MTRDVDVVVVVYRSADHLPACLAALPPTASITVVDNASPDASGAFARDAGADVVVNQHNVGFAAAANQGAARGTAPYLFFLNPDAFPQPGCVERLRAALEADPGAALAGPTLIFTSGELQRAWWPFPTAAAQWGEALGLHRLRRAPCWEPSGAQFLVGACLLVRRAAWEQVGGFDEQFWLYGEEADLAYRLRQAGWGAEHVPAAVCRHIGGASGGDTVTEEFLRGTERFIAKHHGAAALVSHRVALLCGSVLRAGLLGAAGRGSSRVARRRRLIARRMFLQLCTRPLGVTATFRPERPAGGLSPADVDADADVAGRDLAGTGGGARQLAASGSGSPVTDGRRGAAASARVMPHRPRVVYLDHCALLSGAELALRRLLPYLDVEAHVILAADGPLVTELQDAGISVEVLPLPQRTARLARQHVQPGRLSLWAVTDTAAYVGRLYRRLRQLEPDLVHTNSLKAAVYGIAASRLARRPVVVHLRDRIAQDYLPRPAVLALRFLIHRFSTAIIANSCATLETLPPTGAARVISSAVIYDSVRPDVPRPDRRQAERFGMLGRVAPWKGQDIFLRAFAAARAGEQRALVAGVPMFGEDAFMRELIELAQSLGIASWVDFVGFVEPEAFLSEIDILVHASRIPEPFGQVVVEGMAAGLPVIAADAGGPAEIINHGVDGWLTPPNDVSALADALVRLQADRTLRRALGINARRRAEDFSPDKIAGRVQGVYEGVLAAGDGKHGRSPTGWRRRGGTSAKDPNG